jgi:hypothetical protein
LSSPQTKAPLPVELFGPDAEARGEGEVRLTWQTASETGDAGFAIQFKTFAESGAATWEKVSFAESRASGSTASRVRRYRFTDEGVPFAADSVAYHLR